MCIDVAVVAWQVFAPAPYRRGPELRHVFVGGALAAGGPAGQTQGALCRNLLEVGLVLLVPAHGRLCPLASV